LKKNQEVYFNAFWPLPMWRKQIPMIGYIAQIYSMTQTQSLEQAANDTLGGGKISVG